jgi:hypothetical protein
MCLLLAGKAFIRPYMPDQHRVFFMKNLQALFVGSRDPDGRVWASVLPGPPGFVESPAPTSMTLDAPPIFGGECHQSNTSPERERGKREREREERREEVQNVLPSASSQTLSLWAFPVVSVQRYWRVQLLYCICPWWLEPGLVPLSVPRGLASHSNEVILKPQGICQVPLLA